ncbi:MAG: hypothetical protein ABJ201_17925, partial [Nisaea sp.]
MRFLHPIWSLISYATVHAGASGQLEKVQRRICFSRKWPSALGYHPTNKNREETTIMKLYYT